MSVWLNEPSFSPDGDPVHPIPSRYNPSADSALARQSSQVDGEPHKELLKRCSHVHRELEMLGSTFRIMEGSPNVTGYEPGQDTMSQVTTLIHLGPTKTEKGKLVVCAAKALKAFRPDLAITTELYASWQAGRIGLLASALRNQGRMPLERFNSLAGYELFSPPECRNSVLPALEQHGLVHVRRKGGLIEEVESIVLTYEGMLEAVTNIYEDAEPTLIDRACGRILHEASRVPLPESAALEIVASEFDEETARKAVAIATNYRIVAAKDGR